MSPVFAYAPILIALPILLIGGIFFVVIPGGFIIVLALMYFAAASVVGAISAAAKTRLDAGRARRRRALAPAPDVVSAKSRQPVRSTLGTQ
jgi:hypothetical protein